MDHRKIFEEAFSDIETRYPFSDERTVVDNVLERAENMKKTDNNDNRDVKELYEITVPNIPARKSRAPLIAGIATLTAAAAGIGFFAGGSYMAANMPDGAPAASPLSGAAYSQTAEQTSTALLLEPSEVYKDMVYYFEGFSVQVLDASFDGMTLDIYYDIIYDDTSLNTDSARAMHPSAELFVPDNYNCFSNGYSIKYAQPDKVTVFGRVEFTEPYSAVNLNFYDFYKTSGGRDYTTAKPDINTGENVFTMINGRAGEELAYSQCRWDLSDGHTFGAEKVSVTAHTICFKSAWSDHDDYNDMLKALDLRIYMNDGRIINGNDRLLASSFSDGTSSSCDIIYHFDDIDLLSEIASIQINDDIHLLGKNSTACITTATEPIVSSAYYEGEVTTAGLPMYAYIDDDGACHFSDMTMEQYHCEFDGRILDLSYSIKDWTKDYAPALNVSGADLVLDRSFDILSGIYHFRLLCDMKDNKDVKELNVIYFSDDGKPEYMPIPLRIFAIGENETRGNNDIRYNNVGVDMDNWNLRDIRFERMISSHYGLELDFSSDHDCTEALTGLEVYVKSLDGKILPMSDISILSAVNEDNGQCFARVFLCPDDRFDYAVHNRVSVNGMEIKFSEFDTAYPWNGRSFPEDIAYGNYSYRTVTAPYVYFGNGNGEAAVTCVPDDYTSSPECTTVTYPQPDETTATTVIDN